MSNDKQNTSNQKTNQTKQANVESTTLTKPEVKEVVAETVAEMRTTTQERPIVVVAADAKEAEIQLPTYDMEKMKTLNVSQAVRYLHSLGYTRGQIVKEFPKAKGRTILYQHVRNVLITPVKAS